MATPMVGPDRADRIGGPSDRKGAPRALRADPEGLWHVDKRSRSDVPPVDVRTKTSRWPGKFPYLNRWEWALMIVMIIAIFTRFVDLGKTPLFHDEAYYWVWSQHITWGNLEMSFYDHPAGVAYLIVFSTAIFGDSEFGVRAIFAIIGVLNVWLLYYVGKYFFDQRTGVIAAFLLAVNFGHILLSRSAMNDVAACFVFTVILYFFAKAVFERSERYLWFTGIALGIGFLVKYTVVVIVLGFLIFAYAYPEYRKFLKRRTTIYSLVLAGIITTPFWVWNATHDWAGLVYQGGHASPFLGLFIGGDIFANQVLSWYIYPLIWFLAISLPLTAISVAGLAATFKFRWNRENLALALGAFIIMIITYGQHLYALTMAFELIFWYGVYLAYKGFKSDRDALLGLTAIIFIAFFAFSLGRMPHWMFPAFAPISIAGARWLPKAYSRVSINRKQATAMAIVMMLSVNWMGAYALNGAVAMGNGGQAADPKSIIAGAWTSTTQGTVALGNATAREVRAHPEAVVLVPNWVTYSPVKYYLHREGVEAEIYTWVWDYQIGTDWKRDVKYMPNGYDSAIIPVYDSSFLGRPNEDEVFMYLLYSSSNITGQHWWGNNDQTCYAKTGFDYYEVVEVGSFDYNSTFLWIPQHTQVNPYFIVYAQKRGSDNVTLIYDGMKYTAPKTMMTYEGQQGKDWLEFFHYEPVVK
jgi:4-amino-4-deoxy-L-arabinose transferase-like glycosyltransferase